jgi:hypothetical protein
MVLMMGRYSLILDTEPGTAADDWTGRWKIHYTNAAGGTPLLARIMPARYANQRDAMSGARQAGMSALDALIAGRPAHELVAFDELELE